MSKTVFIFDDDADILLMSGIVLKQKGYTVHTCTNCDDILTKVKEVMPDVILMDNKIAPEGGIFATRLLKNEAVTRHIPVIFFSANTNVEQLSREAEADRYIQKPFDITDLEMTIEKALAEKKSW